MAKSKLVTYDKKKQEILNYLVLNINNTLFSISKDSIIEKFKNEHFDEQMVKDLIDELIKEDLLNENQINLTIVYPKANKKQISARWNKYIVPFKDLTIYSLVYLLFLVTIFWQKKILSPEVIFYPVMIISGVYSFKWGSTFLAPKLKFLETLNYKLFFAWISSILLLLISAFVYSNWKGESISTTLFIGIIGAGATVGTVIYKIISKDKLSN